MYMCVWVCVCMSVYVFVCTHLYMLSLYIDAYKCVNMFMCVKLHMHVQVYLYSGSSGTKTKKQTNEQTNKQINKQKLMCTLEIFQEKSWEESRCDKKNKVMDI